MLGSMLKIRDFTGCPVLAATLLLAGCAPAQQPVAVEDAEAPDDGGYAETFVGPPRQRGDLLFVVGDSPSMGPWQDRLIAAFVEVAPHLEDVDLRIAVISTAISDGTGGAFLHPADAAAPACQALDGAPPVVASPVRPNPAWLADRFACLAAVGTRPDTPERGLDALTRALRCDGPNAAWLDPCGGPPGRFLRADAGLLILIVSDTDDCADDPAACAAPVDTYARQLHALAPDTSVTLVWSYVPPGTAPRYVDFSERSLDRCVPAEDGDLTDGCALTDAFTLDRLHDRGCDCFHRWCLERTPACVAEGRECQADELELSVDCSTATTRCDPTKMGAWIDPAPTCPSGASLSLTRPLPADARLSVRYR